MDLRESLIRMSEVPLYNASPVLGPDGILFHIMYSFRKSPPPQDRQLVAYHYYFGAPF